MNAARCTLPCLALLAALEAVPASAEDQSYSFVRVLEGSATISPASGAASESAEVNLPLLTGDRVETAAGSRLELVLADRNRLRVDGGSAVVLAAVAFSSDASDRVTRLQLLGGSLQLSVGEGALGDELPRIDLRNATVYVHDPGSVAIESDGQAWSEVVVRRGTVEVLTDRGSTLVRAGEAARISGSDAAAVRLTSAPPADAFERWAMAQETMPATRSAPYVDDSLAYSSSSLDDYGSWVQVESSWAWRPRVAVDWRPYWHGRWHPTPSGLTWVSSEPWGWVPYHYGSWDLAPGYGWVWYPGRVYSPAWVYWYWGDSWAGWCPTGYYTRHYRPGGWHHGFRAGLYGSIGGGFDLYAHWNFGPSHRLFDRHHRGGYRRGGAELAREIGGGGMPRGILTTDTRGLDPRRLREGRDPRALLRTPDDQGLGPVDRLPDLTEFIARKPDLAPEVRRRVWVDEPAAKVLDDGSTRRPSTQEGRRPGGRTPGFEGRVDVGAQPQLDERPARRAGANPTATTPAADGNRGARDWTSGQTRFPGADGRALGERPARPGPGEVAPQAVPPATWRERPGSSAPTSAESVPAEGRQNWRRREPGTPQPGGETSWRPTAGSWSAPETRQLRGPSPPAVEGGDVGRRVRPQVGSSPSARWSERPAPAAGFYGTAPSDGDRAPVATGGGSGRPPVRRVIDGVRQGPAGGSAAGSASSSWQQAPRPSGAQQVTRPAARASEGSPSTSRGGGQAPREGGRQRADGRTSGSGEGRKGAPPPPKSD